MKLDPNNYCVLYEQNIFWAIIHDVVAHPLMALTFYKINLFIQFHNYTSNLAWKRRSELEEHFNKGVEIVPMDAPTGKIYSMKLVKRPDSNDTYVQEKYENTNDMPEM